MIHHRIVFNSLEPRSILPQWLAQSEIPGQITEYERRTTYFNLGMRLADQGINWSLIER